MLNNYRFAQYPCPLCGTTHHKNRYNVNGFKIVQCIECGMVYVSPRVCNEQIADLYKDQYFQIKSDYGYENYTCTAELRRKTFRKWFSLIEPLLTTGTTRRALDVGCAAGYFLEVLQSNNWHAEGIELDSSMFKNLIENNYTAYNVPIEQFVPDHKYQLITLFDVLEHLPDLDNDFQKFYDMLEPGGILALVTPNFNSLQRRILQSRWYLLKPLEHITYFTPKTLRKIASKHGFSTVRLVSSGQYADISFLKNRLRTYNYKTAEAVFNAFTSLLGLSSCSWYIDAGSMLAVLKKD